MLSFNKAWKAVETIRETIDPERYVYDRYQHDKFRVCIRPDGKKTKSKRLVWIGMTQSEANDTRKNLMIEGISSKIGCCGPSSNDRSSSIEIIVPSFFFCKQVPSKHMVHRKAKHAI